MSTTANNNIKNLTVWLKEQIVKIDELKALYQEEIALLEKLQSETTTSSLQHSRVIPFKPLVTSR